MVVVVDAATGGAALVGAAVMFTATVVGAAIGALSADGSDVLGDVLGDDGEVSPRADLVVPDEQAGRRARTSSNPEIVVVACIDLGDDRIVLD